MNPDHEQAYLELLAHVMDLFRKERNKRLDELQDSYSHCRTKDDRLDFLNLTAARLQGRLASYPAIIYQDPDHFCRSHLAAVDSEENRRYQEWYLRERGSILDYVQTQALQVALGWVEARLSLYGKRSRLVVSDRPSLSDPVPILTILKPELLARISLALAPCLTAASRPRLRGLLTNQPVSAPLVIATDCNLFIDAFAQLADAGLIQETKSQLRDWLVANFVMLKAERQQPLKASTVWDYLTKVARKPAYPLQILP